MSAPEKIQSSSRCFASCVALKTVRLVDKAERESVADVDIRQAVLRLLVIGIEWRVATIEGAIAALHLAGIGGSGPGVVRDNLQTVREGAAHCSGQRVVPGVRLGEARVVGSDGLVDPVTWAGTPVRSAAG